MAFLKKYYLILVPVLLIIFSGIYLTANTKDEIEYFGIIETNEIDVASKIPGRIDTTFVKLGERVKKGDILAKLESKELDAKLEQARGVMLAAKAKLDMANKGAREEQKRAAAKLLEQAKYQYEFAKKTYERMQKLFADSIISRQKFDEIEFKYNAALAQYEAAQAKMDMANNGAREEEKSAAEALYHQALNAYNEAQAYYKELSITAPADGEIYEVIAEQGEIIAAGYPIFSIVQPEKAYAVINVREDNLKYFKTGKKISGYLPALDKNIDFVIDYISPVGNYATWKPTNQKGEFDLKTFEIHLSPVEAISEIRPGMNVKFEL